MEQIKTVCTGKGKTYLLKVHRSVRQGCGLLLHCLIFFLMLWSDDGSLSEVNAGTNWNPIHNYYIVCAWPGDTLENWRFFQSIYHLYLMCGKYNFKVCQIKQRWRWFLGEIPSMFQKSCCGLALEQITHFHFLDGDKNRLVAITRCVLQQDMILTWNFIK